MIIPIPAGRIRCRKIIRSFLRVGAVSKATAKTPEEAGVIKGLGLKFNQLVNRGILVPCENDRYYVDQNKL